MRNGAVYEAIDSVARNNIVSDTAMAGLGSIAGDNVRFENNTVINAARVNQAVFRAAANEYNTAPMDVQRNRAITDQVEPGSVFKIVAAGAALDLGHLPSTSRAGCGRPESRPA